MSTGRAEEFDVVIVGTGHAGATVAAELVGAGFTGTVALVGAEDELPYERPPLSKAFLLDTVEEESLLLKDRAYWQESGVRLVLGRRVDHVDAGRRTVRCADGSVIGYGTLVWAAGGDARALGVAGEAGSGTHTLRNLSDARELRAAMGSRARFVVVGGGFIGLEAAAAFASSGIDVTVLEMQDRLLARVTGDVVSEFFLRRHRSAGVDVRLGAAVAAVERTDDLVTGVSLQSGEVIPADGVLVAVGLVPAVGPLIEAGATGGDGVDVDACGLTSLPAVYAVGDCARFPYDRHPVGRTRLESIQNAVEQGKTAARAIMGTAKPYEPQPWFWSNQYDIKFKTVGLLAGHDTTIVRGDPGSDAFSVAYLRDRTIVAVDSVNHMRDYVGSRIAVGREVDPAVLADAGRPLKEALVAPAGAVAAS